MKTASALVLLGAALLLISGANCTICPAVEKDVDLFMKGTVQEYVAYVSRYQSNPFVVANAKKLKQCIDTQMTDEDKDLVLSGLDKVYKSSLC